MAGNLPQLLMRRPALQGLPPPQVPDGYVLRPFRDGDEAGWGQVMDRAFEWEPGHADFSRLMRADEVFAPERVKLVLAVSGQVVATASCWPVARYGPRNRMLHWVATHPDHAGRGLGFQVSLAALHHAAGEGCRTMTLLTDDFRTAALKTYLHMGFEPLCTHSSHPERWRLILRRLGRPGDYAAHLAAPLTRFD